MTPLRIRRLEDLRIRNLSPHTIDGYTRYVAQFAKHFETSPDQLGPEHVRTYLLYLIDQQVNPSILTQTVCGLRVLYEKTLRRTWLSDSRREILGVKEAHCLRTIGSVLSQMREIHIDKDGLVCHDAVCKCR